MSPACEEVLSAIGDGELPPALAEHAQGCEHCRPLLEAHRALGPLAGELGGEVERAPSEALAEIAAHPVPRPWWTPVALLLLVEVAAMAAMAARMGPTGLSGNTAAPAVVATLAALLALSIVLGAAASFARSGPRARWVLGGLTVALAGALVAAGSGWGPARPLAAGAGCGMTELAVSALPWVLCLLLLRRTAFDASRAWLGGLCAGAAGALILHFQCGDGSPAHLLLFHVLPWLLLGVLAVLTRSRLRSTTYAP
jgi:hypothetical protein